MAINQPLAERSNDKLARKQVIGNHFFDRPEAFYYLTKARSLGERGIRKIDRSEEHIPQSQKEFEERVILFGTKERINRL